MVGRGAPGIVARDVWRVPIKFSAKFNLGAGISVVLPDGVHLIGIYCDHANFADVEVETQIDSAWQISTDFISGSGFNPRAQTVPTYFLIGLPSDGTNLRIHNTNVAATNNIIYIFVDA